MYNGDIRLGSTIDIKFTTTDTAGVPIVLAGTPVVSAYVGNSTVEITAGITLIVDLDTRVGLNNVRVVASGANGFATATDVALVITTGTIGGASAVGYAVGSFSIENRSAVMPATAGRTLVIDAAGLADANAVKLGPTGTGTAQTARDIGASVLLSNGTGAGQVKIVNGYVAMTWADIDAPTTAVALTGTTIATSQVVASVAGQTLANLDAAITTRMASYAQPTGFLAANFPVTVASSTNITAGTITTTTNLTNAPTAGDLTATMKTSVQTAVAAELDVAGTETASVPLSTATLRQRIAWLFALARNKVTQTATTQLVRNDADGATIGTSTVSDDGTTYIRGKFS